MEIDLGVKARAHERRAGHPWLPESNFHLSDGPHLFLDWRFVLPGELGLIGPYWAASDGRPIPLRVAEVPEWKDGPIEAKYVPQDVPQGIRIVTQPAEKGEPFPENGPPGTRIVHNEGVYHTWYKLPPNGEHPHSEQGVLHYAESSDGFNWQKVMVCEVDWSACPEAKGSESPEIFLDPSGREDERFKMFVRSSIGDTDNDRMNVIETFKKSRPDDIYPTVGTSIEHLSGMYGAVSPDGIHWKGIPGPLVIHYSDTTNVVHYDAQLERYVWYARCNWFYGRRSIGRAETNDFRQWPGPDMLVWPSTELHPTDDWYTNSKTTYPGTDNYHLMFPALYHHFDDTSELRMFSSPDGMVWSEVPGGPVLSHGMPGDWDGGCIFGGLDLIQLPGNRIALPYSGYLYPHKFPRNNVTMKSKVAYAYWPDGRLGALEAEEAGNFTTLPLMVNGRELSLNLQTKHAGHVLVEVTDRSGRPLPGRSFAEADTIVGDHMDQTVTWNGESDLRNKSGQPIMFRFKLRAAKLFAFRLA